MTADPPTGSRDVLTRLASLRQHQQSGRRFPHKPLLVLLALGRLHTTGVSDLSWADAQRQLGDLIVEYGPASTTSRAQGAAYPFTRLRSDGVWVLDHDVPMDNLGSLNATPVIGRFAPDLEHLLAGDRRLVLSAARTLVEAHFPAGIAVDVLSAVGLDPDLVLHTADVLAGAVRERRRDPRWRDAVLQAWDRQCAFCGFDGQILGTTVGIDAAHVRWFAYDGPDDLDNGLALCVLHHQLFDRGALGLDDTLQVHVSASYTSRTTSGRSLYALHGHRLDPRPGTLSPARRHVAWHRTEVFKGQPLAG
jgi:putative restriction endonuclease